MSLLPHMLRLGLAGGLDQGGELAGIIGLTVAMTLISTSLAALAGFPAGVALAARSFPGKRLLRRLIQTLMSLPPVVAGLAVFLVLSRRGPLGSMNLLFSLPAMVIAQFILIFPIIVSLTLTTVESRQQPIRETLGSLGLPAWRVRLLVLWETRRSLLTIVLTGFGPVHFGSRRRDDGWRQHPGKNPRDDDGHSAGDQQRPFRPGDHPGPDSPGTGLCVECAGRRFAGGRS